MADALTDTLKRWDPTSQELGYNNLTDRIKVELPEYSDPSSSGVISNPVDAADFTHKYAHLPASSIANVIWTPATGKRFVITDMLISAGCNGFIKLYDGVNDASHTVVQLVMPSGATVQHPCRKPYPSSAINTTLYCDTYAGCSGDITTWGYEV
jgi:hypothetical protein